MTFKALSPAEMRKLAEAAIAPWTPDSQMALARCVDTFRAAANPSQILHDADLIEAQGKRVAELLEGIREAVDGLETSSQRLQAQGQSTMGIDARIARLEALLTPEGAQG